MTGLIQVPLDTICKIKESTTTFDKACKIATNSVGGINAIAGIVSNTTSSSAFDPLTNLSDKLGIFSSVVGGLNILSRMQEVLCKNPKINDYAWKAWKAKKGNVPYDWMRPTWTPKGVKLNASQKKEKQRELNANLIQDPVYWSRMKIASQTFLTAAHAISAVEFMKSIGLYSLGSAAPFIGLTKNVLYLPSSALGLADSAYKIHMSKVYVRNCENKERKWSNRTSMSLDALKNKYSEKIDRAKGKIASLDIRERLPKLKAQERKAINLFNDHLRNKIQRWELYQSDFHSLENQGLDETTIANHLTLYSQLGKDCASKMTNWSAIVKIAKGNQKIENVKNGINIAYQVLKIAFGIIGVTLAVLKILSVFGVMTPIAPLALAIMGMITGFGWAVTESVGLSKEIYGFFRSSRKIEKPHLQLGSSTPYVGPTQEDVDAHRERLRAVNEEFKTRYEFLRKKGGNSSSQPSDVSEEEEEAGNNEPSQPKGNTAKAAADPSGQDDVPVSEPLDPKGEVKEENPAVPVSEPLDPKVEVKEENPAVSAVSPKEKGKSTELGQKKKLSRAERASLKKAAKPSSPK